MYTINCCGMIAMKREVAALPKGIAGFPWSECQEAGDARPKNLTASHCTNIQSVKQDRNTGVKRADLKCAEKSGLNFIERHDTHGRVYSHRLSYLIHYKSAKRRRLFLWQVK